MAKFNDYLIHAENVSGEPIVDAKIEALGLEQAFHKAVTAAFEAVEPGTGERPHSISVARLSKPSEHHG